MTTEKSKLAEAGLYFVLAASHLAHRPATHDALIAIMVYVGLAALHLGEQEDDD